MSAYAIERTRFVPKSELRPNEWERGPKIFLTWLVAMLAAFIFGFVVLMSAFPTPSNTTPVQTPYSYSQLEADRAHMEYMSTEIGSQMHMEGDPMWERAADPIYRAQLQAHMDEIDRMLGRSAQP